MANDEHLAELKKGVESWNQWRRHNTSVKPDLSGVDFTSKDVVGELLWDEERERVDLSGANLGGAILLDANLEKANLFQVNLKEAKLRGTSLSRAYLSGAILIEANLSSANLRAANLKGASLNGANLSKANLSKANLSGAKLSGAKLIKANLSEANLERTNLSRAHLGGSHLNQADLREANLSEANLERANLRLTYLSMANLSKANLSEANLYGAHLREANLSEANLSRAKVREAYLREADLTHADLTQADLTGAILTRANLEGAYLTGARLIGTDKDKASLDTTSVSSRRVFDIIKDHPVIGISLLYAWVSVSGIVYFYVLLRKFGINFFDFAEANDFFLAAFRQPVILLIFALAVFRGLPYDWTLKRIRTLPRREHWFFKLPIPRKVLSGGLIIFYAVAMPMVWADGDSRKVKHGLTGIVQVSLKGKPEQTSRMLPNSDLALIATTEKFAFFYALGKNRCVIIPITNIGSITVNCKDRSWLNWFFRYAVL